MVTKIQHFEQNTEGRDFVVGDLHGCFDEFNHLLAHVAFDKTKDRVFSVGDLVDRGPKNIECLELLKEPWFFAVQGNHEDLMVQSMIHNNGYSASTWMYNGGTWGAEEAQKDRERLVHLATLAEQCPLIITVGEAPNRFNVVHAEMFYEQEVVGSTGRKRVPLTDGMIDAYVFDEYGENNLTWGRNICQSKVVAYKWHDPEQMSLTFVGHTPMREVVQFGQQMYIDLGGCFFYYSNSMSHDNSLVLAEPLAKRYFRYRMVPATITEHSFDTVEKWAM